MKQCTCTCMYMWFVILDSFHSLCVRIKQELVPLVRALCQDVDPEVRMKMCKELPRVAEALG